MSIKGKLETINKVGLKPFAEGLKNKVFGNESNEKVAQQRANICVSCVEMEIEPVEFMRVEDNKIPAVSNMMCGDCFCSIPLKIRQDKILCKKWL